MPVCSRCNASGRCKNCSCKKSGKPCNETAFHLIKVDVKTATPYQMLSIRLTRTGKAQARPPPTHHLPFRMMKSRNNAVSQTLSIRLTELESPSTATTYSSSSLSHEEGPKQGSELPNTSLLEDNLHTLPSYSQIHEPSFTWGKLVGKLSPMPSCVAIRKLSIGNVTCSRFLLVELETRWSKNLLAS